jgi:hypothetical protein
MYELNGQWHYQYKGIEAAHGSRIKTYWEFPGQEFLQLPNALKSVGVERVVFWFDNRFESQGGFSPTSYTQDPIVCASRG